MDNTVGSLTKLQRSIVIGTILGDGYLRIISGRKNALLEINHSITQREYVDWKYTMLKSIAGSPPKERISGVNRRAYRFYSKQLPEFTELFNQFYKNGKKIIPQNIVLNPMSIAVWFMDDGSYCRESDVYLNTQQFSLKDQKMLSNVLTRIGLKTTLNKDKQYYRLRFLKESIPKLKTMIGEFIIPSMRYKFGYNPVETFPIKSGGVAVYTAANTPDASVSTEDEDIVHTVSNN